MHQTCYSYGHPGYVEPSIDIKVFGVGSIMIVAQDIFDMLGVW